jgi:hypothetical protein
MSQKVTAPGEKKSNTFLRAFIDLVILALLLGGSGFGGYFWGIHQQLAPVLKVAPGTPGALPSAEVFSPKSDTGAKKTEPAASGAGAKPSGTASTNTSAKPTGSTESGAAAQSEDTTPADTGKAKAHGPKKFWIASTGVDYIGYSITVKVNGTAVDSFFGPGKIVDITHLVKPGDNTLVCEAKEMGDQYNKHSGDAKSKLTLQLVSGLHISDSFKKSDILVSYQRTAADSEDATETQHFSGD